MTERWVIGPQTGDDSAVRIKRLRVEKCLTQQALADRLGVSFTNINRWKNAQTHPFRLYWKHLQQVEMAMAEEVATYGKQEVACDVANAHCVTKLIAQQTNRDHH